MPGRFMTLTVLGYIQSVDLNAIRMSNVGPEHRHTYWLTARLGDPHTPAAAFQALRVRLLDPQLRRTDHVE